MVNIMSTQTNANNSGNSNSTSTPKEAKLIYTTINESLKVKSVKTKNKIKEGFASKAAGTSTKNKQATNILEDNQVRNRFMQLAGLLKENK